jgi:2-oxo-4-hydroxy-4-carboxy--5-ureidoimidazoline (OHCU) decarboxylase
MEYKRTTERHHNVRSQFGTIVVDDSHITERSAKIIRPYAFISGMSGAMNETYQRDMRANRLAALRKRLERVKGTNHDDT